jgi:hypothetical protein
VWSIGWAVVFVAVTSLLSSDTIGEGLLAWTLALGTTALGVGGLLAYRRYISEADELTRRIQLEGVAFGFSVGLLVTMSYRLFDFAGSPELDTTDTGTIMLLAYIGGVLMATRRYR